MAKTVNQKQPGKPKGGAKKSSDPELKKDGVDDQPPVYYPVVRNIQTNDFYTYLGENKFRNIKTKVEGEVPTDKASALFKVNIDATKMFNEFPLVNDLINKLNLTFDNNQKQ